MYTYVPIYLLLDIFWQKKMNQLSGDFYFRISILFPSDEPYFNSTPLNHSASFNSKS